MKGYGKILDKLLLGVGLILLVLLWVQFPAEPVKDLHVYNAYTTGSGSDVISKESFLRPDKELSPHQVMRIQLRALQQNDRNDSGVITIFNFSSPVNKMNLGPINHFRLLVREPAYRPMLNFKSYKSGKMVITDNTAYQIVVIAGQDDIETAYLFILAKQKRGPYKGCWMTEGVARMEPEAETHQI
ncbi:DUF4864 domain-containing protein [Pontibacter qinzhouensis]|uniref:DUF4864 domain-containing protein n=1 Tax=Pontibacter qinzhouensis TaxID=2603253 RepID=A0A5C8J677_9BACT|nr:DUF4864 domain-containing protein [Pontibacter qinzhouensis]TXK31562.1 DUF4864 domain-containing protein [Pontibacter qinzhouensis]